MAFVYQESPPPMDALILSRDGSNPSSRVPVVLGVLIVALAVPVFTIAVIVLSITRNY